MTCRVVPLADLAFYCDRRPLWAIEGNLAYQIHDACIFSTKTSPYQFAEIQDAWLCRVQRCLMPEAMSSLPLLNRWLLATSFLFTHYATKSNTCTHTRSYMVAHVSHAIALYLLHLKLWASCIFNQGNLHRHFISVFVLCLCDCLSPYLHSRLTLQLLIWGHIQTTDLGKITRRYCFYHTPWSKSKNRHIAQLHP